jgi:hypothetical protein
MPGLLRHAATLGTHVHPAATPIAGTSSISKRDVLMRNTSLSEMRKDGTFFLGEIS